MKESLSTTPITYSIRERLLINLSLATFLLVLAQLPWLLAGPSFFLGGIIFLVTLWWGIIKTPLPRVSISVKIQRPQLPELPRVKQPTLPHIELPRFEIKALTVHTPRVLDWKIRSEILAMDEVRFSLLLLTVSLLLGFFYTLSFIRFLNAHDGLSMFFVWEGIR